MLLAHSADLKNNIPEQSYSGHVNGVISLAGKAATDAAQYSSANGDLLKGIVCLASEYHDLGKLDAANQDVLAGLIKARNLPVQHTDAGTALLINNGDMLSAVLAYSHHIGLPDWPVEKNRSELAFRDKDVKIRGIVDKSLKQLCDKHSAEFIFSNSVVKTDEEFNNNPSIFMRIALSCLADGDHTDTAIHYGEYLNEEKTIKLRPAERLIALDGYVSTLGNNNDERSILRYEMYRICRNSEIDSKISSCDSPVGTGKTTAVMAHLLMQAEKRKLRRIIVVLPFTNIITQSVEVYRKALVLPGENPEDVVAELHHRADFQDAKSRHLTALWKAPIIVTTAVAFFETLASNAPSTLRRLHNLPGSAVFIDESHAALPAKLLPLAWHWMKGFAFEWNCYWVLASGSLNRFWQIAEFDSNPPVVPEIVQDEFRGKLAVYETDRVAYRYMKEPQNAEKLTEWISSLPGPRIVILNTVQSAAVIALEYKKKFGRKNVEHLSTALTPVDRAITLERIKHRLKNKNDNDWALIATSCVEAGVDISFRTGIREMGSLVSLLQISGRVNRSGNIDDSEVWTIRLREEGLLKTHPGIREAAQVLRGFLESDTVITPALCTEALKREIRLVGEDLIKLYTAEVNMRFPLVEKEFKVINTATRIVLVNDNIAKKIEKYEHVDWREIQDGSVQIWGYKLDALEIKEINGKPGVYKWTLAYDDFIGYMAGVLTIEEFTKGYGGAWIV